MDLQDQREIADALLSTKGDVVKRQQAALRRLQTLISGGVYPGQLLTLVAQVVCSSQVPDLRREAAQALGGALGSPQVRERCSAFGELLSTLWGAIGEVGEAGVHAVIAALASLAPEDAATVLMSVDPDALVRRATEHRVPTVRPLVLQALGELAVRAWPFAAAGQDVSLRDACVDVLRLIFGRLSAEASPPGIRTAAAGVLDALMKAYLNIDPAFLAPVALLHVGWSFAPVYATLLVELSHDLEPAVPVLCAGPGSQPLADESCLWAPLKDGGGRALPADRAALVAEAAALRAGLLWILVHSGGLARRYPEESGDQTGSLIFELVREVTSSSKEPPAARPMHEEQLPAELCAALRSAAALEGDSWGIRFARSRASLMLAVLEIARGALGPAVGALLAAADALARACRGSAGSQALQRLAAEALCSIAALWPLLGSDPPAAQREHFARTCAEAVSAAAVFHRARAGEVPARLQQLTLLATGGLVWAVVRPGPAPDLQALFGEQAGGLRELPGAVAAALCTECARAMGRGGQAEQQVARSLAESLIRTLSPRLFAEAAAPVAEGASAAAESASAAQAAAGCWCLLSLAAAAQASALLGPISDALLGASQLQGSPNLLAMLLATLRDLGALGLAAGASRAAQALQGHAAGSAAEMAAYLDLLAREVRSPGAAAPLSARLATPLCAPAGAPLESSMWLHALAGEGAADESHAPRGVSVSGPPLMVYVRLLPSWSSRGCSHVVLRIDIYNVTGLIYHNIKVDMGVSISSRTGARDEEQPPCALAAGLSRPGATALETLTTREKVTVWRELRLSALQPLCATVLLSYENTSPETAGGASASSPQAASADVWSDDEDEENFVLEFACKPCAMPLSVFFAPFHGFDAPAGGIFPPPVLFAACPHARAESVADSLPDLLSWSPPGFHRIERAGRLPGAPDVQAAFAAVAFDGETVVCLLCRGDGPAPRQLEARSSSEMFLSALMDNLLFWVMATER